MTEIESIMHGEVVTIDRSTNAHDAARVMKEHRLGALVVTADDGTIHGVFSERDLMNRIVAEGRNASEVPVGDVCTLSPTTVEATASLGDALGLITQKGFRHLPIRDANNRPVGIVSARDFLRFLVVETDTDVSIEATCAKLGQLSVLMERLEELR